MSQSHQASNLSRIVFGYAFVVGILAAFGVNTTALVGLPALLLVLVAALYFMARGRFPQHFWLLLLGLIIGPALVCCLFGAVIAFLRSLIAQGSGAYFWPIALVVLVILSFLYVRRRQAQNGEHKPELHTNEREPLPPAPGGESDIHPCAESHSSNDYSSES